MWVGDGLGLRDWKTGFLSPDLIMDRNFFHPQHTLFGCIFVFQICAASNFLDDNSSCKPSPSGQFETRKLQQLDGGSSVYIICWLIALWQVPQFCNLIGFGIGFYMPWKLGSNAPEISNLLFSLFLWTESQTLYTFTLNGLCLKPLLCTPPLFLVARDLSLCWRHATDFHANHLWGLVQIYTNGSLQSCNFSLLKTSSNAWLVGGTGTCSFMEPIHCPELYRRSKCSPWTV